jgi:hypothetical protein
MALHRHFDGQGPVSEGQIDLSGPPSNRSPISGFLALQVRYQPSIEKNHRHGSCFKNIVAERDSTVMEDVAALKKHASDIGAFIAIVWNYQPADRTCL